MIIQNWKEVYYNAPMTIDFIQEEVLSDWRMIILGLGVILLGVIFGIAPFAINQKNQAETINNRDNIAFQILKYSWIFLVTGGFSSIGLYILHDYYNGYQNWDRATLYILDTKNVLCQEVADGDTIHKIHCSIEYIFPLTETGIGQKLSTSDILRDAEFWVSPFVYKNLQNAETAKLIVAKGWMPMMADSGEYQVIGFIGTDNLGYLDF